MKINKKSWHYKLLVLGRSDIPRDICSYFRAVLFSIFCAVLIVAAAVGVVSAYAVGMGVTIYGLFTDAELLNPKFETAQGFAIGITAVFLVFGSIAFSNGLRSRIQERRQTRAMAFQNKHLESKPPSLFQARMQALKAKTCVMLEFEDE